MFVEKRTVRLSECGIGEKLSLFSILNYFQDVCEDCELYYGFGTKKTRRMGYCYVVLSWDIIINRYADINEEIEIREYLNKHSKRFFIRSFEIVDSSGAIITAATSNIGVCSAEIMKLAEGPDELVYAIPLDDHKAVPNLPLSHSLERNTFTESRRFSAVKTMVDINGHVNNANYIHLLGDDLPDAGSIRQIQMYYYMAVMGGETLVSEICDTDDGRIIRIISEETGESKFLAYVHTSPDL